MKFSDIGIVVSAPPGRQAIKGTMFVPTICYRLVGLVLSKETAHLTSHIRLSLV